MSRIPMPVSVETPSGFVPLPTRVPAVPINTSPGMPLATRPSPAQNAPRAVPRRPSPSVPSNPYAAAPRRPPSTGLAPPAPGWSPLPGVPGGYRNPTTGAVGWGRDVGEDASILRQAQREAAEGAADRARNRIADRARRGLRVPRIPSGLNRVLGPLALVSDAITIGEFLGGGIQAFICSVQPLNPGCQNGAVPQYPGAPPSEGQCVGVLYTARFSGVSRFTGDFIAEIPMQGPITEFRTEFLGSPNPTRDAWLMVVTGASGTEVLRNQQIEPGTTVSTAGLVRNDGQPDNCGGTAPDAIPERETDPVDLVDPETPLPLPIAPFPTLPSPGNRRSPTRPPDPRPTPVPDIGPTPVPDNRVPPPARGPNRPPTDEPNPNTPPVPQPQPQPEPQPPQQQPQPQPDCCDQTLGLLNQVLALLNQVQSGAFSFTTCGGAQGESFTWEGPGLNGINAALAAVGNALDSINLEFCDVDAVASMPESWQYKTGGDRPQAAVVFKSDSGSHWTVHIPHYDGVPDVVPDLPSYRKGNAYAIATLRDNSKIHINAVSQGQAEAVVMACLSLVKTSMLPNPPIIQTGDVRNAPYASVEVKPYRLDYYAQGRENARPDYSVYWNDD